jgi:EAL domain-containing protein (putative c-di-GMP-specific phosphodiesterase class I)/GAF domain-containing protein
MPISPVNEGALHEGVLNEGALERGARARRYNHALVALGRRVWHEDCTYESALAEICEVAAEILDVDRVNVWRFDPEHKKLYCVHAYERYGGRHHKAGDEETLRIDSEYGDQLDEVRVIDIADAATDRAMSGPERDLDAYLKRHNIHSLLDAPVRAEGSLLGVVCHEHVGGARVWTPEEHAFAGSIGDYVAVAYEIARRREIEQRLRFLERHDPHTKLPNRDHLVEVAHSALRPLHESDSGLVVIHLQIEGAESDLGVNPEAYQRLLLDSADALREMLVGVAVLARVRESGLAIIPHRPLKEIEALELAERCIDAVQSVAVARGAGAVMATAGIAFSRDLAAPSADTLLRNAENASLRARSHGSGRCKVFNADRHRDLLAQMRTEQALRDAIDDGRMLVHYMPEVDLRDGRWRSAEALLRWRDEDGRILPASDFIEVAEASGLIVRLGRWVLLEACTHAMRWPAGADGKAPLLRVNVSVRQFEEPGLISDVLNVLSESGLPPQRLCLELTETLLLREPAKVARGLARLRSLGVRVALDDFGTGYCSLGYLKHLPIDTIKIDRGFTAGLPHDRADLAIVKALVGLADSLGIDVVGEGVENEAQAQCLRECGVVAVQGYLYSKAIDGDSLIAHFADRSPVAAGA